MEDSFTWKEKDKLDVAGQDSYQESITVRKKGRFTQSKHRSYYQTQPTLDSALLEHSGHVFSAVEFGTSPPPCAFVHVVLCVHAITMKYSFDVAAVHKH